MAVNVPPYIIDRKKRMQECVEYLRQQKGVKSLVSISRKMKWPASSFRSALHLGSRFLSNKFIDDFLTAYPDLFSKSWIMEGLGKMLLHETPIPYTSSSKSWAERSQRFLFIMDQEGEDYLSLSDKLNLSSYSTIYRISKRESSPRESTCQKLLDLYPHYSKLWLLHGKGPIYNAQWQDAITCISGDNASKVSSNAHYYSELNKMEVPFVPVHARAGFLSGFEEQTFMRDLEIHPVLTDKKYFGKYMLFEVDGDSMTDGTFESLLENDVLLCREIRQDYWMNKLHTHHWPYFVFVTRTEGIIVKSIKEQDTEKGIFVLHSLNDFYEDITLHIQDIQEIYNVVQLVARNFKK